MNDHHSKHVDKYVGENSSIESESRIFLPTNQTIFGHYHVLGEQIDKEKNREEKDKIDGIGMHFQDIEIKNAFKNDKNK